MDDKKAQRAASKKAWKKKDKDQFMEWKATLSCTVCGENHPATLDFHHHTPHPDNIKINMLLKNKRCAFARKEIEAKCIVLCANCHRKHHHEERLLAAGLITER